MFHVVYYRNKDELCKEVTSDVNLFIFGCPRDSFTAMEYNEMKSYLSNGGRVLILLAETDKLEVYGNMNKFLEE